MDVLYGMDVVVRLFDDVVLVEASHIHFLVQAYSSVRTRLVLALPGTVA
jgi:hypothetical protein